MSQPTFGPFGVNGGKWYVQNLPPKLMLKTESDRSPDPVSPI